MDAEQSQMNLGIMAGERRAALAKAAELADQKRLLVSSPSDVIVVGLLFVAFAYSPPDCSQ